MPIPMAKCGSIFPGGWPGDAANKFEPGGRTQAGE